MMAQNKIVSIFTEIWLKTSGVLYLLMMAQNKRVSIFADVWLTTKGFLHLLMVAQNKKRGSIFGMMSQNKSLVSSIFRVQS